jgi:pre-rRNA-processing protein RIX1
VDDSDDELPTLNIDPDTDDDDDDEEGDDDVAMEG